MKGLRIAIAQIETIVGDIQGNSDKIISWVHRAREADADLVCFPELAVTDIPQKTSS